MMSRWTHNLHLFVIHAAPRRVPMGGRPGSPCGIVNRRLGVIDCMRFSPNIGAVRRRDVGQLSAPISAVTRAGAK